MTYIDEVKEFMIFLQILFSINESCILYSWFYFIWDLQQIYGINFFNTVVICYKETNSLIGSSIGKDLIVSMVDIRESQDKICEKVHLEMV